MAHSQEAPVEAVDVPVTHTVDSAAAALSQVFQEAEPEQEAPAPEETPEDDLDLSEGDETEEPEGEQEVEPETPAIDAPVSLSADEKAAFAQLPPEAQDFVSRLEQRRNQDVQKVTTKAAEAQREAEARAAAADNEAKQAYAAQLKQFVAAFEPQAPDPQLAYQDPQRYVAAKAQYDASKAQHDELVQQITAVEAEAKDGEHKAFIEARDRELMAIPEIANPETRQSYLDKAFTAADLLGYDRAELLEGMTARDVKALALVADMKAKAEKYDAAMSRKMQRVREGKARSLKPGVAQPEGSGNRAFTQAKERLARTGKVEDAAAAFKAILT